MKKSIPLPPEEVRQKALEQLIASGVEPSAENLIRANKRKGSPLFDYFKSLSEKEWAEIGQYQAARKIITHTTCVWNIGGKKIETRYVEVVRDNGEQRYAAMGDILADPHLRDSYMAEISGLMKQAQEKMERLRALMQQSDKAAA